MGKINVGRVVLGGLLAGVVLNIGEYILNEPILGQEWKAAMERLNVSPPEGSVIAWYVVMGFILGIAIVWLYAAIRPRYGAGPKTAIIAGLAAWFFVWLWGPVSLSVTGLFPAKPVMVTIIWGFFEAPIAALAGAWLYREEEHVAEPAAQ